MPLIVSGPSGRSPTQYLFVDGAYLRSVLERKATRFFGGEAIEVDYHSLFVSGFNKRFYYDCLPPKKNNETRQDYDARIAPAIEHYNALRALDGFHVFLGTTASEGTKARQKGVDIMIAVHMLTHSFRRNMDKATLLTGDLDFKPLIEALVQDGMDVTLWFEPCSTSKELVYAADSQRELSITSLLPHTTPQFRQRHPVPNIWNQPGRKLDDFVLFSPARQAQVYTSTYFRAQASFCSLFQTTVMLVTTCTSNTTTSHSSKSSWMRDKQQSHGNDQCQCRLIHAPGPSGRALAQQRQVQCF